MSKKIQVPFRVPEDSDLLPRIKEVAAHLYESPQNTVIMGIVIAGVTAIEKAQYRFSIPIEFCLKSDYDELLRRYTELRKSLKMHDM